MSLEVKNGDRATVGNNKSTSRSKMTPGSKILVHAEGVSHSNGSESTRSLTTLLVVQGPEAPIRLAELIEILVPTSNLSIANSTVTVNLFEPGPGYHESLLMPEFRRTAEFVTLKAEVRCCTTIFLKPLYSPTVPTGLPSCRKSTARLCR